MRRTRCAPAQRMHACALSSSAVAHCTRCAYHTCPRCMLTGYTRCAYHLHVRGTDGVHTEGGRCA
eukprot:3389027-Rhodomonas_salina.1